MIEFSDFRNAITDPPTEDGLYLVITLYRGKFSSAMSLDYTTEYGWNTSENHTDHAIVYTENEYHTYWWARVFSEGDLENDT